MKLTSREQEIVEVLIQDPLVSQEDLAARFGISRSSVAVHISNLMKKGVILGRGYVFNKKVSAVVVGEAMLRINVGHDQHGSRIETEYSGFALEVSQALARLGLDTKLLAVVGNDELGSQIISLLKKQDVDVSNMIKSEHYRTPRRIYVDQVQRYTEDIAIDQIKQSLDSSDWLMQNCDWLLIDSQYQSLLANKAFFREEISPVICTCGYLAGDIPDYLRQYNLLVLGVNNFQKLDSLQQTGLELIQAGVRNCIITDGGSMMMWFSQEGVKDFPLTPSQSFDSANDLHLFLAGLVYGLSAGYPMRQAIRIATANASKNEL